MVKPLFGPANPPSASDVIEGRLIEISLRALELGVNVVVDYGLWARGERSTLRQAAAERGAAVEMRYFELTPAEQGRRLGRRLAGEPHTTWHTSEGTRRQRAHRRPTRGIPDMGDVAQASVARASVS